MTIDATLIETSPESYRLARTKAGKNNGAGQPARVSLDQIIEAAFIAMSAGLSGWAFVKAWNNFRLHTCGQWIEAEIVRVREDTDSDGDPRFCPEVAFTPPESDEVRGESKIGRLCPIHPGLCSS